MLTKKTTLKNKAKNSHVSNKICNPDVTKIKALKNNTKNFTLVISSGGTYKFGMKP